MSAFRDFLNDRCSSWPGVTRAVLYELQLAVDEACANIITHGYAKMEPGSIVLDLELNTAFQIIAQILYNTDATPQKKAIVEAGLCKDFGGLFLGNSSFTTIMMTYLIGSEPSHLDRFREVYRQTLSRMVAEGLDRDLVLSELNKFEFSVREDMTKAQRGLELIGKALPAIMHGSDPFAALCNDELFRTIRAKALDGRYFEQLISDHLLANPSTVEIILRPDQAKQTRMNQEEQQRLADYENSLSTEEQEQLVRRTRELVELQNRPVICILILLKML